MKVFAGYFMDEERNENPATVHICTSEKELVDKLAADIGTVPECQTLDELDEKLQESIDSGAFNGYTHISYNTMEL